MTIPVDEPLGRWELPAHWRWLKAREFSKVIGGGTPKNASDPSNYADDGTPWLTPADLSGYSRATIARGRRSLSLRGLEASSARRLPRGTVLISSRAPVGYCAVAENEVTTNQGFRSLVCGDEIDPFFVRYYILLARRYLEDSASGTTFKELSGSALGELLFPIPPLETQRRIVARIDELFSELDDGVEELRRAQTDLNTYRKALLKAAVTGELTADWRAAQTQRRGLQRNVSPDAPPGRRTRQLEPSPEQLALMWEVPESWKWSQVGRIAFVTKLAGFEYTKHVVYNDDGDLPVLKAENAGPLGFRPTQYSRVRSSDVSMLTRSRLHGGEVLIVFVGAGTGQVAVVPRDQEFFLGPNIGMIRPSEWVSPEYLELYLRSPVGKQLLLASMKAVAQPSLSMTTIRQTPLALPSIEEQEEIVSRTHEAMLAAGDLQIQLGAGASAALRQSILAAAFRGELIQ